MGETAQVTVERGGDTKVIPFAYTPPVEVAKVTMGSAADDAGIKEDDVILAIEGEPMRLFSDVRTAVQASEGRPIEIRLRRGEEELTVSASPEMREFRDENNEIVTRWLLGVTQQGQFGVSAPADRVGVLEALQLGVERTWAIIAATMFFLYELIAGRGDLGDLGGPIRIAEFSGEAAKSGFETLIGLTAVLSASIGLLNLFPIPVLDGGHLLFYAIEAVRGKPLNERAQEIGLTIGFALIIMLMVFATWNDVGRFL